MTNAGTARIDHLLTYVPDLGSAGALFERMGFYLSPVSHIESMGIANRMILMQPKSAGQANFIELMSPYDRGMLPMVMQKVLSGDAGLRSMVLVAPEIEAFHGLMLEQGFASAPPAHAKREWKIPGEASVFPEFDVIFPVEMALRFNACKYYNLHLYLREDWTCHPNSALRLTKVIAVAEKPADFEVFSRLFGHEGQNGENGSCVYPSGEIVLEILRPQTVEDRFGLAPPRTEAGYLGYEIEVRSIEQLRGALKNGDVPFHERGNTVCVEPDVGLGCLIVFSEAEAVSPCPTTDQN
jgi:hypothetical protein